MAEAQNTSEHSKCEEPKKMELPKLSAKDFKVYNNMAEHMDYYVSISKVSSASFLLIFHNSTTISVRRGQRCTVPARP
jgi:hypothetical protein